MSYIMKCINHAWHIIIAPQTSLSEPERQLIWEAGMRQWKLISQSKTINYPLWHSHLWYCTLQNNVFLSQIFSRIQTTIWDVHWTREGFFEHAFNSTNVYKHKHSDFHGVKHYLSTSKNDTFSSRSCFHNILCNKSCLRWNFISILSVLTWLIRLFLNVRRIMHYGH